MAYSDFDLKKVKQNLGINLIEKEHLFSCINPVEITAYLKEALAENIPLARAINTEKARSELIIANILVELRKILHHSISLFSGVEFNVDKDRGLNGFCDFIISASTEQLMLCSPVIAVVEAKNENIIGGLGQCIAEMVAVKIFNEREKDENVKRIYGVVTTGTAWKFLKMNDSNDSNVYIDLDEYSIESPDKIIGILLKMVSQEA